MPVKIGLVSDVHASPDPLLQALEIFRSHGVETILCAGDVAGYGSSLTETIDLLVEHHCQVILGNHDLWQLWQAEESFNRGVECFLRSLPAFVEVNIAGRTVYMVHASPPDSLMDGIRLLDDDGMIIAAERTYWDEQLAHHRADVMVVGHTHQVFAEQLGGTLVLNPGSTLFNHSCMTLSLPDLRVEIHPLPGRSIVPSWHWGQGGVCF